MARVKCPHCFHVNPDQQDSCQKCSTLLPKIRIEARSIINDSPAPQNNKSPSFRRGQVVGGRYTVLNLIGQGGMGCIYKVHDNTLGEDVALKTLLPQFLGDKVVLERFYNEAKIARRLAHPNIVRVHDIAEDGNVLYISMEYLQGMSLREVLESLKPGERLPIAQTLRIFDELCAALEYAHQFTIHRDIKPENVMLGQDGRVRLMDFGISKLMANTRLTGASVVMGTPFYMSPEQIRNSRDVDARSDIYSVGVMLYEILTGSVPTGIPKPASQLMSDVPPAMDRIVVKCVDPNPKERYQNATELRNAFLPIREILKSSVSIPKREANTSGAGSFDMKKIGGAVAALLIVSGSVWSISEAEKHRKEILAAGPVITEVVGEAPPAGVSFAAYEALHEDLRARVKSDAGRSGASTAFTDGDRFWDEAEQAAAEGNEALAVEKAGYAFQCYAALLMLPSLPGDMVFVSPGPIAGTGDFVGGFFIDRDEVTIGRYREFIRSEPLFGPLPTVFENWGSEYNDYPISDISCLEAMAMAASQGCTLPTRAQWIRAAAYGDSDDARWPDGSELTEDDPPLYNINYASETPLPAARENQSDLSRFGCRDLVGNVSEWTRTSKDEVVTFGSVMTICGGNFSHPFLAPEDASQTLTYEESALQIGFRCAREIPSTPGAIRPYLR